MTIEQFWKSYLESKTSEIFDTAIDFFNGEEIAASVIENEYDLVGVVSSLNADCVEKKDFDKLLKLEALLQEKQPFLFAKSEKYILKATVVYQCFQKNQEALLNTLTARRLCAPSFWKSRISAYGC